MFDTQQLVVFCNAVASGWRASFDLTAVSCHRQVGNGRVFGFATAMTHHAGVTILCCKCNGVERFCQCADLIDLDQHAVCSAFANSLLQSLHVGHEQVVANELNFASQFCGECRPTCPVVFGHAVFNGNDWVFVGKHVPPVG